MAHDFEDAHQTDSPFVRNGIDLRVLARRQRMSFWLLLGCVIGVVAMCGPVSFGPGASYDLMMATLTVLRVIIVIGTLRLMSALGSSRIVLVIMAVLMLFPLINLIALIMENIRAANLLRRAGIAVRFLGARDDDVVRCLAANVCRQCGYDLMLNESGRCPECGTHLAGEATKELAIRRAYQRIVGPPG